MDILERTRKMNNRLLALAVPMLLAGCALTPAEVVMQNNSATFSSSKTSASASRCLVKSINNTSSDFSAYESNEGNNAYDVTGRFVRADNGTMIVYQVRPAAGGSKITAYVSGNILGNKGKFSGKIAQPCL
jgi:hypothetical protein